MTENINADPTDEDFEPVIRVKFNIDDDGAVPTLLGAAVGGKPWILIQPNAETFGLDTITGDTDPNELASALLLVLMGLAQSGELDEEVMAELAPLLLAEEDE